MADLVTATNLAGVRHGFSTRRGLEADDILPGGLMLRARQVHSCDVLVVERPWDGEAPTVDALVTRCPGLVLGIVTADCAPVLFADREAGVVGAAHAGWRGAHGGILENTVAAMCGLGAEPERIAAAIGPTIAQASYEVDEGFRALFAHDDARFFDPGREGRFQFDLPAYVRARLQAAGVADIADCALDTYAGEARFFSYRRATHRGEDTGGRQISAIALG